MVLEGLDNFVPVAARTLYLPKSRVGRCQHLIWSRRKPWEFFTVLVVQAVVAGREIVISIRIHQLG